MSTRTISSRGKRRLVAAIVTTLGLTVVAALLAVIVLPATGRPAHASGSGSGGCFSNTGPVCTFKGGDASADFGNVSSDGCVFTNAEIQPFQNLTRPGNVTNQMVSVSISVFDVCGAGQLVAASNFDSNTQDLNFSGTIQFGDHLSTARAQGTAIMFDFLSNTTFTATIDVVWQGYGPTTRSFSSQHCAPSVANIPARRASSRTRTSMATSGRRRRPVLSPMGPRTLPPRRRSMHNWTTSALATYRSPSHSIVRAHQYQDVEHASTCAPPTPSWHYA